MAQPLAGGRRGAARRARPRRRSARAIAAVQALRGWRDGVRRGAGRALAGAARGDGYERTADARRAAGALRVVAPNGGEPVATVGVPGGRSRCSPPTRSTSRRERAARGERAQRLAGGDRARRGQARQRGLRGQGAAARRAGRARQARAAASGAGRSSDDAGTLDAGRGRTCSALELFGMRFGLERMRRLLTALGSPAGALPRRSTSSGTNGKTSTVRMTAAILERHGVRTGAYLSPHLDLVRRAHPDRRRRPRARRRSPPPCSAPRAAAEKVDRTLERRRARHAVRAADRGGVRRARAARRRRRGGRGRARRPLRRDQRAARAGRGAHQRRRSSTRAGSARRSPTSRARSSPSCAPGATLVLGELTPTPEAEARGARRAPGAAIVRARDDRSRRLPRLPAAQLRASRARRPRRCSAALDDDAVAAAAAAVQRARAASRSSTSAPLTIFDGAHNPSGDGRARRGAAGRLGGARSSRCCPILDDKDAAAMLRELLPPLRRASSSRASPNPRALSPATLASLGRPARRAAGARSSADPRARVERAARARRRRRRRARDRLDLPGRRPARAPAGRRASRAVNERGPSVLRWSPRGGRRRARDPGVLRARLRVRTAVPLVTPPPPPTTLPRSPCSRSASSGSTTTRSTRPSTSCCSSSSCLARAGLLDVRGRAPAHRRPACSWLRDGSPRCSRSSGRSST